MGKEDLIDVLGRAMVDKEFLNAIIRDVNEAINYVKAAGGELDEKEIQFLKEDVYKIKKASESLIIFYNTEGEYGGKGR